MIITRRKLKVYLGLITLLTLAAFFMFSSFTGESRSKNHAHQYYQSLTQGQNSSNPEELIKEARAKQKGSPIYLVVYKRSCSRCQEYQKLVREKVETYKKEGATILVAEAPEKGDVSSYPSWIKQFNLPHATTPVIIRYDVSSSSPSEALTYTNFQVYSEHTESWMFEVNI